SRNCPWHSPLDPPAPPAVDPNDEVGRPIADKQPHRPPDGDHALGGLAQNFLLPPNEKLSSGGRAESLDLRATGMATAVCCSAWLGVKPPPPLDVPVRPARIRRSAPRESRAIPSIPDGV